MTIKHPSLSVKTIHMAFISVMIITLFTLVTIASQIYVVRKEVKNISAVQGRMYDQLLELELVE